MKREKAITNFELNMGEVDVIIKNALNEDIKDGDITTDYLIPEDRVVKGFMKAKAEGVVAGLIVAERVFRILDQNFVWNQKFDDGEKVKAGDILVEFEGSYRAVLTGERTALNFLQRMSGIATMANKYSEVVADLKTEILDTRKTIPGLRILDKYAVSMGGATNHRIGLFDMVMIKDNHIQIAGGINKAVEHIRSKIDSDIKIEVETSNMQQVKDAVDSKADIIMLDNMSNEEMKEAVEFIDGRSKVEASGNVTLDRLRGIAETGVDYISVGALTHSVKAMDIGQYIMD